MLGVNPEDMAEVTIQNSFKLRFSISVMQLNQNVAHSTTSERFSHALKHQKLCTLDIDLHKICCRFGEKSVKSHRFNRNW